MAGFSLDCAAEGELVPVKAERDSNKVVWLYSVEAFLDHLVPLFQNESPCKLFVWK